ncbi:Rhodanese-related sulfurtransferase [Cohaesibacter sp. ES.047]|uniref:rhodanese-like domain-containing protein n=1 Tax=Cohaesibacter sp. ES.047 TaxID=1798205 RepID=UPI000BB98FDF|nr:rhodanese-like domain-containing protein [Cohaesibacter sp. ES.047]SNY93933.1 Rhodanese-related sulfurtransferase [Cohaesibacter sp. ES.047]
MAKKQIVKQINFEEAKALIDQGAVLIDVREKMELARRKVPSALHHPLSGLSGPIETNGAPAAIFFCASGARTNGYAPALAKAVDCDAYMLNGGIHALARINVPMETGGGMFKLFGIAAVLLLAGWATGIIPGL